MKTFKFLILLIVIITVNSCGFFFPKREKQVFKPELIETGFVFEKHIILYDNNSYRVGQIQYYNVVVLDSCKNRTTYHTDEDCFNSLNPNDAVNVYTIEKLTKKYEVYSIKKFVKEYE